MIKTFLPIALSGHLLHKSPQFWPGKGRGTVQVGSTVPISSLPLFKPVKSNPQYYYFSPELCVLKLCGNFWILLSGLLADLFLKVNFGYVEELNCLTCLWHFSACSIRWTIYENFGLPIVTRKTTRWQNLLTVTLRKVVKVWVTVKNCKWTLRDWVAGWEKGRKIQNQSL